MSVTTIRDITEAVGIVARIRAAGMMPLLHGTSEVFDAFEIDPARSNSYGNCKLGIHVTSNPYVALDYADNGRADDAVLILAVPPGPMGLICQRDLYIHMDEASLERIMEDAPSLTGLYAEELGDDLSGSGIIFDPDRVEIVARIPIELIREDLYEKFINGDPVMLSALDQNDTWPGAEWVSLDMADLAFEYEEEMAFAI